jgi:hypothetical protein
LKNTGSGIAEAGKAIFNDGKTEVLGGGGKYKGAMGSGEFTGKRISGFCLPRMEEMYILTGQSISNDWVVRSIIIILS